MQKAPYDPINVEQAIREFVAELPRGEAGYLDALRAYTDSLYAQMMATAPPGKRFFLDKTPAYALVLPFLTKLYPQARYVVLTRHPLAVLVVVRRVVLRRRLPGGARPQPDPAALRARRWRAWCASRPCRSSG